MLQRILFLLLCTTTMAAQDSPYRLAVTLGSQHSLSEPLNAAPAVTVGLERTRMLGIRSDFFVGAGFQYGSHTSGLEDQSCDFILGQKVANFNFSETYASTQLNAFLSIGLDYHLGNFRLRGALHPTLRVHSRIRAAERFDFNGTARPSISNVATVSPGERFRWNDGVARTLNFDTPFQLQGSLEVDFDLTPGVALGLGVRQGLFDQVIRNNAVDWAELQCDPEPCSFDFTPYQTGQADLKARTGYVTLRLSL